MEPVLLGLAPALITGAITAVVNFLNAFGWLTVTPEQLDALNKLAIAVMLVLAGLGTWYARRKSTPVAAPVIPQGTTVTVVTPAGEPNTTTTV